MKSYRVQVTAEFNDELVIEANDPEEAKRIAENEIAEGYNVLQQDTKSYFDFDEVYAYEPEEL